MTNLLLTLTIAFVIFAIAIGLLAIGWLITGKVKLRPGSCGKNPHMKQDESCGKNVSCALCEKKEDKKQP